METEVLLSIGSNDKLRHERVSEALDWLRGKLDYFRTSQIYPTLPVRGAKGEYVNAVAQGRTTDLKILEADLKLYELSHGRDAAARAEGRVPIDIDVVVVNGEVVRPRDYACDFFRIGLSALADDAPDSGE